MTVAAIIFAASPEAALADAAGQPRVRRLADAAWSGGAVPVIVVAPDPNGSVARALAGATVTLAAPAPAEGGTVAQIVRGIEVAAAEVRGTTAALVWPDRICWAGPETATSLIEAHGADPESILRPSYRGDAGWPTLVPLTHLERLRGLGAGRMPDELLADAVAAGVPSRSIELGDPGTVMDASVPLANLPQYEGPPEPAAPHAHEWGAAVADLPDDTPIPGPAVVPYEPDRD